MMASDEGHQKGTSSVRSGHLTPGRTQVSTPGQRSLGTEDPTAAGHSWWHSPAASGAHAGRGSLLGMHARMRIYQGAWLHARICMRGLVGHLLAEVALSLQKNQDAKKPGRPHLWIAE
jgi:hypothetical protein